ncbi:MAG: DUF3800 domain-containing protein [Caldilineaceae bacterium]|nr:DUF3800 domain-containing protein [Caldilineaceae bacterium]HRJ44385.1 hypothetical protein [Caldilineaceae bacterium]
MHILYLDDSGSVNNANEDYFVLGGVSVPEASVRWLSHQLELLAQRISPSNYREVEFHAADIFGGRDGIWRTLRSKNERIELLQSH